MKLSNTGLSEPNWNVCNCWMSCSLLDVELEWVYRDYHENMENKKPDQALSTWLISPILQNIPSSGLIGMLKSGLCGFSLAVI